MRRFFIGLLAAVALVALALGALSIARDALDVYDPVQAAREQAALDALARQQEIASAVQPAETLAAAMLALAPAVALYGAMLLAGAWGSLALARFLRERRADSAGRLPVPVAQLPAASVDALAAFHMAQLAAAQRQPVPHSLNYSPSISYAPHSAPRLDYRHHGAEGSSPALLPADVAAEAVDVPRFAELIDAGRIGRGNPMLLGFDAASGGAVEGSWLDLYSCGLGGLSGSGKTWTACYLTAQAVLFGTRVALLDPHAGHAESLAQRLAPLSGRFVCAPAESPREMLQIVELVAEELRQRKAGKRGEPLLFIADEYSALQRGELAEPLAALVEALGQEGRKMGMYAMVAGQVWTASRAGGTEVRDSLASAFVHRCRPAQARYLTGLTAADLPHDLLDLPSGTAYLLNTAGDFRKVAIPQMAATDLARVAELAGGAPLDATAPAASPRRPVGFRPAVAAEAGTEAAEVAPLRPRSDAANAWTPEEAQIVALLAAGRGPREIVKELYGATGGDAYTAASAKVRAVLAKLAAQAQGVK